MIIARRNPGLPDPVWVMHWSAEITVSGPNLLRSLEIAPTAFVSPRFIVRKVFAPQSIFLSFQTPAERRPAAAEELFIPAGSVRNVSVNNGRIFRYRSALSARPC